MNKIEVVFSDNSTKKYDGSYFKLNAYGDVCIYNENDHIIRMFIRNSVLEVGIV